jgi:hypothetical protein
LDNLPASGKKINLQFQVVDGDTIDIPFTEIPMAAEWAEFLKKAIGRSN